MLALGFLELREILEEATVQLDLRIEGMPVTLVPRPYILALCSLRLLLQAEDRGHAGIVPAGFSPIGRRTGGWCCCGFDPSTSMICINCGWL